MANKITQEESDAIYNKYQEIKNNTDLKLKNILQILQKEFERPRTSCYDHSRGRELKEESGDIREFKPKKIITEPVGLEMPSTFYKKAKVKNGTYILTSWDIRVGINENFIKCLKVLSKELDAEMLLAPLWLKDIEYIPKILKENFKIITRNIRFNDNLIFHYIPSNVLLQSAISSFRGAFPDDTVIIPGAIREIISEPSGVFCKQLISTSIVGRLDAKYNQYEVEVSIDEELNDLFNKRWNSVINRSRSKPTAIAQLYAKPSALIIDVKDNKTFITRYVTMEEDGVIYDLNKKITTEKITTYQPPGLITGDYHAYEVDLRSHKATKDMISELKPKEVVLNDFFDGKSCSHWEVSNPFKFAEAPSIKEEASVTKDILNEICEISNKVVWLQSNHCNFLSRHLETGNSDYHRLNNNFSITTELKNYMMETGKHPIIKLLDLESHDNLHFSPEKEIYKIAGVIVMHGHEVGYGRMGTRGTIKRYNKIVVGHFHSPEQYRNGMVVGLIGNLEMEYSTGYNGIMPSNGLIHSDGSLQLLPIIHTDNLGSVWK